MNISEMYISTYMVYIALGNYMYKEYMYGLWISTYIFALKYAYMFVCLLVFIYFFVVEFCVVKYTKVSVY